MLTRTKGYIMNMRQIRANALKQAEKIFVHANRLEKIYKDNGQLKHTFGKTQIDMLNRIQYIMRKGL